MMKAQIIISLITIILATSSCGIQMNTKKLPTQLDALLSGSNNPGAAILVTKEGKTVFSYYRGATQLDVGKPISENTHFRMASLTKQLTAHAIYNLIKTGELSPKTYISEILPNWPDEFKSIQIHHLLEHSSGLPDYEENIPVDQVNQLSDNDVFELTLQNPTIKFPAGHQFSYSNTGYCLLALIVKKISHESFANYVKENLFVPIDINDGLIYDSGSEIIERAYGYHPDSLGYIYADQSITSATQGDGGAYMSTLEMQKWHQYIANQINDHSAYRLFYNNGKHVKDNINYQLGLFNFRDKDKNLHLFHSGESTGFENITYLDVKEKLSIIVFTNRDDQIVSSLFEQILTSFAPKSPIRKQLRRPTFLWLNKIYSGE